MSKLTKRLLLSALAIALTVIGLWLLLFEKSTLTTPRFLRQSPSARHQNHYEDRLTTSEVNGQVRHARRTTVTESMDFFPEKDFAGLVSDAEAELTSSRGWDLAAVPKDKVARFYQRTSNTTISLYLNRGRSKATVSQTRFATPVDRFRHWWKSLGS